MRRRPLALAGRQGFTLAELLIVVAVSTMGFVALFDLQANTLRGMGNMVRLTEATNLAENFLEELRLEFMQWTDGIALDDATTFPSVSDLVTDSSAQAGDQTTGDGLGTLGAGWIIASQPGDDRRVSAVGDLHPLGFNAGIRPAWLDEGMEEAMQPYCMLYRLTWLIPGRAIRAEVEVSWPLDNADMSVFSTCQFSGATRIEEVRSVTMTSTLMINLFNR